MASAPFIGEIRMFGGSFAPLGWTMCNGQTLSIAQNDALFTLIGTTYGGDGITTFNLPDLRSRVPIHQGQALGLSPYVIGQVGGTESVTLTTAQMPQHNHAVMAAAIGNTDNPVNGFQLPVARMSWCYMAPAGCRLGGWSAYGIFPNSDESTFAMTKSQ